MLLSVGLSSFDTVIHNYRRSFLYMNVWSKHSNALVKLLRCVSLSAFLWLLLCFLYIFYLFCLSLCMSLCVCDSNKMMMMTIGSTSIMWVAGVNTRCTIWNTLLTDRESIVLVAKLQIINYKIIFASFPWRLSLKLFIIFRVRCIETLLLVNSLG